VIGPEGQQLGIMLLEQARLKAQEFQLDLVEVAPTATPPVCKIMDYGKHVYQEQKKEQQAHKKSHSNELKEVRLRPRIGKHDLGIKVVRAREFLSAGHRVQFTMVYKGRERTHQDIGEAIMKDVVAGLAESCKVERGPFREGGRVGLIVAPKQAGTEKAPGSKPAKPASAKPASAKPASAKPAPTATPAAAPTLAPAVAAAPAPASAPAAAKPSAPPDAKP
jgi:translation initiation factor IF-3